MTERGTVFIYEHAGSLEELKARSALRVRQGWQPHGEPIDVEDISPGRAPGARRFSQAFCKFYLEPMPPVLPHRFLLTAR
jgi:hypothetical protein